MDILPTRARLAHFIPNLDTIYHHCGTQVEDLPHILLACPLTKAIRLNSQWQIKIEAFSSSNPMDWIFLILDPNNIFPIDQAAKQVMIHFLAVSLEHYWWTRNCLVKGEAVPSMTDICS